MNVLLIDPVRMGFSGDTSPPHISSSQDARQVGHAGVDIDVGLIYKVYTRNVVNLFSM